MKYFYTDPLAAAWMAKHFGMRYNDIEGDYHITDYLDLNWEDSCSESKAKYYIHPDSLRLLEPQVGDVQYGGELCVFPHKILTTHDYLEGAKIIQRNGIPFMWPESENV